MACVGATFKTEDGFNRLRESRVMGGCRAGIIAAALILVLPLVTVGTAAAFSVQREGVPIRVAIAHGPVPPSGVVAGGPAPGPHVTYNVTLLPFGAEYRVTNHPAAQNEVSIAIDPGNARNIVTSANDYRGYPGLPGDAWCGVYTTRDGGLRWLEQLVPRTGALLRVTVGGDPSVAFDANGNAYVTCLGFSRSTNDNVIAVSRSLDGGMTWGTAAAVVAVNSPGEFHDKQYIVVDQSSGPTRGSVYVTWTKFMTGTDCGTYSAPILFSRSTDGGTTWSVPRDIAGAGYRCNQGSQPSVGPAGELYVSWMNYFVGGMRVVVVRSLDGGRTWGPVSVVSTVWNPGELYGGRPRTPHFPSLAVNPVNGMTGNRVHVVWADRRSGNADILMSTSINGGASWGTPVRVNDPGPNAQFFPWVAASGTGRVQVAFYDRRDDPSDRLLTVYVGTSYDFGATFAPNRRASAQFDPGTWFIGDYIGVAAVGDFAYPAWCDLRNGGNEEVYIAGLAVMTNLLPPVMPPRP